MTGVDPVDLARRVGLAYAAILLIYYGVMAGSGEALLAMLLIVPFQVGPVAIAAVLARASRTAGGAWLFVALELVLVALAIGFLVDVRINHAHWAAAGGARFLAYVGPLCEYGAVLLAFAAAWLGGWRPREDWLKA